MTGPVAILPKKDFRGDPFGDGNEVAFRAGILSSPVPAEFARAMRDKGLATFGEERPAIDPPPAKVARKITRAAKKSASDKVGAQSSQD